MFSFTRQEKTVIITLIVTFTIGTGIITFRKLSNKDGVSGFNSRYSELDKKFSEISKNDSLLNKKFEIDKIKIDINTADKNELMKLPGIGTELSERIINYRNSRGGFEKLDEITNIKGIGKKRLEKILPFIYIE